jgi:hypothetical protein
LTFSGLASIFQGQTWLNPGKRMPHFVRRFIMRLRWMLLLSVGLLVALEKPNRVRKTQHEIIAEFEQLGGTIVRLLKSTFPGRL